MTKEVDLHEDMASHDAAIKKFKNYKSSLKLGMYVYFLSFPIFEDFYKL